MIVPDGPLHELPFAALWDRAVGRFVIQDRAVLVAPSLAYALLPVRSTGHWATRPALLVGNPATYGNLASLPGAERETAAIARLYPGAVRLTGHEATRERVLERLGASSVVHFAGHAFINQRRPDLSRLVLVSGKGRPEGSLFARDISRQAMPDARLVVLAACDTGRGVFVRGEGLLGLVRSFLAAGVPEVVATLWRVDDKVSSGLFEAFHAAWIRHHDAARALRDAQLATMGGTPGSVDLADWAGVVAVGRIDR